MVKHERVTTNGFDAFATIFKSSLDTVSAGFQAWVNSASHIQAESARFIVERFAKDARFTTSLAASRRPEDMLQVQADGMQTLVSDYLHEGIKLASMAMDAGRRNLDITLAAAVSGSEH